MRKQGDTAGRVAMSVEIKPNHRNLDTETLRYSGLNRCGKSCRLRWTNYLRPDLKHEDFTQQEEERIVQLHAAIGSRWSLIAKQLPGRTDNDVKNYWNTKLKKKLTKMGIDPITHKPYSKILSDYESISSTCLTATHPYPLRSFDKTSEISRTPFPYNLAIPTMDLHHYVLEDVSPSSSSSSSSTSSSVITNVNSTSHQLGSDSSPAIVVVPGWGDPGFGDNIPNVEIMEEKCNFQKFLERDSEVQVQDKTRTSDSAGSPVSSFVQALLDRDSEMQQLDFLAFDDILDY